MSDSRCLRPLGYLVVGMVSLNFTGCSNVNRSLVSDSGAATQSVSSISSANVGPTRNVLPTVNIFPMGNVLPTFNILPTRNVLPKRFNLGH